MSLYTSCSRFENGSKNILKIQHAKFYRDSSSYKNKLLLLLSRASGADLTKFIAREDGTTVYQSVEILTTLSLSPETC